MKKVKKVKKKGGKDRKLREKKVKKVGKFKREKWKGGGGRIRDWDKEFELINVVVFGKYKKIVLHCVNFAPDIVI